jgi:FixJ family two-component response regulator
MDHQQLADKAINSRPKIINDQYGSQAMVIESNPGGARDFIVKPFSRTSCRGR